MKTRTFAAALVAAGAIAVPLAVASPASADSQGCGDNVCVHFTGGGGGDVTVTTWAYARTVEGHFTLTGPNDYRARSDDARWDGGVASDSWRFVVPAAGSGTYCVTLTGRNGENYGTACKGVH